MFGCNAGLWWTLFNAKGGRDSAALLGADCVVAPSRKAREVAHPQLLFGQHVTTELHVVAEKMATRQVGCLDVTQVLWWALFNAKSGTDAALLGADCVVAPSQKREKGRTPSYFSASM